MSPPPPAPKPQSSHRGTSGPLTYDALFFSKNKGLPYLTSDLLFSRCHPPPQSLFYFFKPPSYCLTLQRKSDGRKKQSGGGWRGLASRRRPLPQGLPHPSFRSHPSHLFLSVFRYLYCTFSHPYPIRHSYLQQNSPAQLTRNEVAHKSNSDVRSRTILRPC